MELKKEIKEESEDITSLFAFFDLLAKFDHEDRIASSKVLGIVQKRLIYSITPLP